MGAPPKSPWRAEPEEEQEEEEDEDPCSEEWKWKYEEEKRKVSQLEQELLRKTEECKAQATIAIRLSQACAFYIIFHFLSSPALVGSLLRSGSRSGITVREIELFSLILDFLVDLLNIVQKGLSCVGILVKNFVECK